MPYCYEYMMFNVNKQKANGSMHTELMSTAKCLLLIGNQVIRRGGHAKAIGHKPVAHAT